MKTELTTEAQRHGDKKPIKARRLTNDGGITKVVVNLLPEDVKRFNWLMDEGVIGDCPNRIELGALIGMALYERQKLQEQFKDLARRQEVAA